MTSISSVAVPVALTGAVILLLTGCGPTDRQVEIPPGRVVEGAQPKLNRSDAERFGMRESAPSGAENGDSDTGALRWQAPEAWKELEKSQFRQANFEVPGGVACWLTILSGGGGGLLANINRWRVELGLEPVDQDAADAMPQRALLGGQATLLAADGGYRGESGQRMLAVARIEEEAVFVKMVGPREAVVAARPDFDRFCDSLRRGGARPPAAHQKPAAAKPTAKPTAKPSVAAASGHYAPLKLNWMRPDGWGQGEERQMRIATFFPTGHPEAECTLTNFMGSVADNLNRWREQLGSTPLSAAEIEALEKIPMLGQQVALLEIAGPYSGGMSGEPIDEGYLLGVVCPIESGNLFVKMIGPAAVLRAEKARFVALCASLSRSE